MDLFNLGGTFLRKRTRYAVNPVGSANDGTLIDQVVETSLNNDLYETNIDIGLSAVDCHHVIHHHNEIGSRCSLCVSLNCVNCTHICGRCLITIGSCCTKVLDGGLYCPHCYRFLMAKKVAIFTGKVTGKALLETGKVLLIPFKGGR